MNRPVRIFTLFVVGSALGSCAGDPNPTGPGDDGGDPQMTRIIKADPSFAVDVQEIFVRTRCADATCHRIGQAGLTLLPNAAQNYANIVNVTADREGQFLLIKPFDAENSYIMIRLQDRQEVGVSMPPGVTLDSIDMTNLTNWINNGALNN
jgi:hypothetical protein